jgi:hypothetical protein
MNHLQGNLSQPEQGPNSQTARQQPAHSLSFFFAPLLGSNCFRASCSAGRSGSSGGSDRGGFPGEKSEDHHQQQQLFHKRFPSNQGSKSHSNLPDEYLSVCCIFLIKR